MERTTLPLRRPTFGRATTGRSTDNPCGMSASPVIRNPWLRWFAAFAVWTMLGLAFASQLYLSRSKVGEPVSWGFAFKRAFADWYVYAALSLPALWLANRLQIERGRRR